MDSQKNTKCHEQEVILVSAFLGCNKNALLETTKVLVKFNEKAGGR